MLLTQQLIPIWNLFTGLIEKDVLEQVTGNAEEKPEDETIENETTSIIKEDQAETTATPSYELEASQSPLIDTENNQSGEESAAGTTAISTEETSSKKPSMKFCLHKGIIIQNLTDVPSKDPCQLCQYVEGEIICASQECQAPPQEGCVKIVEEGECCPKYDCDGLTDETTASSGEVDLIKTTASAEIKDNDIEKYEHV